MNWDWTSFFIGYFAGAFTFAALAVGLMVTAHARVLRDQYKQGHF